jgi:hypothetical protein
MHAEVQEYKTVKAAFDLTLFMAKHVRKDIKRLSQF